MSIADRQAVMEPSSDQPKPVSCSRLTPGFGVEIDGVDLTQTPSESMLSFLRRALLDHQVLVFRDQWLNEDQQVQLAQSFGPCREMWQVEHYASDNEFVQYLGNVDRQGKFVGRHPDRHSAYWHVDGTHTHVPSKATLLNALQVPSNAGHTMFASLYQLYDKLDEETKRSYTDYEAEHHIELRRAGRHGRLPWQWLRNQQEGESIASHLKWWLSTLRQRWRDGGVFHPIVRQHTGSGRPTLFVGDHAWRIRGKFLPTGIRLMNEINSHAVEQCEIYTHRWIKGDLVIWDNTSVLHRAGDYDLDNEARVLRRCVVQSE